ncbi:MAG: ribonuclease H-like domain-containing protein [Firmicutes bacterium]|nr:ribonuclease H-like domain-containing protein [Bacillota bacterium]
MKTITDNIQIPVYCSKLFDMYFGGKSFAVFDIETTGLSPANSKVVLTGILKVDQNGCGQVQQFFADQNDDEEAVIRATMDALAGLDYVITYNGRHFDMPFMTKRAEKYGLQFPDLYNLDLYLLISGYAPFKEVLPGLKQKNIEAYMGIAVSRDDEISGKESVELYNRYMQTKRFELEEKILLHNHDDIIQLYKIFPVIDQLDLHKGLFKRGFPAGRFLIEQISLKNKELHVKARQMRDTVDYISFPTETAPYMLMMNSSDGSVDLSIPCESTAGSLYLDARAILRSASMKLDVFPGVTDGYLILSQKDRVNEMEINLFLRIFFEEERYAL